MIKSSLNPYFDRIISLNAEGIVSVYLRLRFVTLRKNIDNWPTGKTLQVRPLEVYMADCERNLVALAFLI